MSEGEEGGEEKFHEKVSLFGGNHLDRIKVKRGARSRVSEEAFH